MKSVLDELIQQGARQLIQQAVETELAAMLEREIVTAVGPVKVKVPKVRDRLGSGIHLNSAVVPPPVRAQVGARVGGAAVAVPARHLDE